MTFDITLIFTAASGANVEWTEKVTADTEHTALRAVLATVRTVPGLLPRDARVDAIVKPHMTKQPEPNHRR